MFARVAGLPHQNGEIREAYDLSLAAHLFDCISYQKFPTERLINVRLPYKTRRFG